MIQSISQMELGKRIQALKEAVLSTRAMKEQNELAEAQLLDDLAVAEAEVLGKAPGWEGVELSGLIGEGENPHYSGTASTGAPAKDKDKDKGTTADKRHAADK